MQNLNFVSYIKPVINYKKYSGKTYFKFLSKNPNWVYLVAVNDSYVTFENFLLAHKAFISAMIFYDPETIVLNESGNKMV